MPRPHCRAGLLAVVTLLAIAATASASDVQYECTTNGAATWEVLASAPTSIECPVGGGECTLLQYTVNALKSTGINQDHVAVLVEHGLSVVSLNNSVTVYPECDGDTVTSMGIRDCSMQAVRLNTKSATQTYDLITRGEAVAVDGSIVIKKGKSLIEECRIASLGTLQPPICDPKAQQTAKETFQFEDCIIEIPLDPCTGEPGEPNVISGDCATDSAPIGTLQLVLNGGVTQNVTIGDGWISSGENSCTTRMFNGTSYTTCTCADASDCLVKKKDGSPLCGSPCPR